MAIFGVKEEWVTEQLQILNSRLLEVAKRNQDDLKLFTESYLQLEARLKQENAMLNAQIQELSSKLDAKDKMLKDIVESLDDVTTALLNIENRTSRKEQFHQHARKVVPVTREDEEDDENFFNEDDLESSDSDSPGEDEADSDIDSDEEDGQKIGELTLDKNQDRKLVLDVKGFCNKCKKNVQMKDAHITRRLDKKYAVGKCARCAKPIKALIR